VLWSVISHSALPLGCSDQLAGQFHGIPVVHNPSGRHIPSRPKESMATSLTCSWDSDRFICPAHSLEALSPTAAPGSIYIHTRYKGKCPQLPWSMDGSSFPQLGRAWGIFGGLLASRGQSVFLPFQWTGKGAFLSFKIEVGGWARQKTHS
jgi:hypothetical protein